MCSNFPGLVCTGSRFKKKHGTGSGSRTLPRDQVRREREFQNSTGSRDCPVSRGILRDNRNGKNLEESPGRRKDILPTPGIKLIPYPRYMTSAVPLPHSFLSRFPRSFCSDGRFGRPSELRMDPERDWVDTRTLEKTAMCGRLLKSTSFSSCSSPVTSFACGGQYRARTLPYSLFLLLLPPLERVLHGRLSPPLRASVGRYPLTSIYPKGSR